MRAFVSDVAALVRGAKALVRGIRRTGAIYLLVVASLFFGSQVVMGFGEGRMADRAVWVHYVTLLLAMPAGAVIAYLDAFAAYGAMADAMDGTTSALATAFFWGARPLTILGVLALQAAFVQFVVNRFRSGGCRARLSRLCGRWPATP